MSGTLQKKREFELEVRISEYTSYFIKLPKPEYCDEKNPLVQVYSGNCVQGALSILPNGKVDWKISLYSTYANADTKIEAMVLEHRREICEAYSKNRSLRESLITV